MSIDPSSSGQPSAQPIDDPESTAKNIAHFFYKTGSDARSLRRVLIGAVWAAILTPLLFYLKFGAVGSIGWGLTIFLVAYCVVLAIGLYFLPRVEYHTTVAAKNDWLDRIGAWWLVACVFGPFTGWLVTAIVPLTLDNWRGLYWLRVILSMIFPLLTALPLLRYVRGRAARVALPLLIGITALAMWSGLGTLQDLSTGPIAQQTFQAEERYLPHTDQVLLPR